MGLEFEAWKEKEKISLCESIGHRPLWAAAQKEIKKDKERKKAPEESIRIKSILFSFFISGSELVGVLPNVGEADGRVEAI